MSAGRLAALGAAPDFHHGLLAQAALPVEEYPVSGMVVGIDRAARTFTASIHAIPGFMAARTMPFAVRRSADLDGLGPGAIVSFTLVVDRTASYAERIQLVRFENVEQDPFAASRLALLTELVAGADVVKPLAIGEAVPAFTLLDQKRRQVSLSQFRGKIVALNFIYTRCALPNFCLRLANNFGAVRRRFTRQLGRDLILVTVTFDPTHDTPDALVQYARQWNADPDSWRFLTGAPPDIQRVCRLFGVHAFANEGLMDHSLHTVVIDRQGKLLANIEGNQFTAAQLGDLIGSVLRWTPMRFTSEPSRLKGDSSECRSAAGPYRGGAATDESFSI